MNCECHEENPILVRYRWTVEELCVAMKYHWRHKVRPLFRWACYLLFAFGVIVAIAEVLDQGLSLWSSFLLGLGVYWFFVRWPLRKWLLRRQFKKRTDQNLEIERRIERDRLYTQCLLGVSEVTWQMFSKMVQSPDGVLLYSSGQLFHWLPRHGFVNDTEYDRFVELAKSKIARCYETH